jgi:hypothetical protein
VLAGHITHVTEQKEKKMMMMFLYLFMYGILGYWIPLKEEEEEEKYVPRYYVRSVSIENGQPHVMERNFYLTMWHSFDRLQSHTHTQTTARE